MTRLNLRQWGGDPPAPEYRPSRQTGGLFPRLWRRLLNLTIRTRYTYLRRTK
jgi:hypothetical protein